MKLTTKKEIIAFYHAIYKNRNSFLFYVWKSSCVYDGVNETTNADQSGAQWMEFSLFGKVQAEPRTR